MDFYDGSWLILDNADNVFLEQLDHGTHIGGIFDFSGSLKRKNFAIERVMEVGGGEGEKDVIEQSERIS